MLVSRVYVAYAPVWPLLPICPSATFSVVGGHDRPCVSHHFLVFVCAAFDYLEIENLFVSYVLDKMYGNCTTSQRDTIMRYGNVG